MFNQGNADANDQQGASDVYYSENYIRFHSYSSYRAERRGIVAREPSRQQPPWAAQYIVLKY